MNSPQTTPGRGSGFFLIRVFHLLLKKKDKMHWVDSASNSGVPYLQVDEMTFFLEEEQDRNHRPHFCWP